MAVEVREGQPPAHHEVFADDLEPVDLRPVLEDVAVVRDPKTHAHPEIGQA